MKCNYIYKENIIVIELLSVSDKRFGFQSGLNWLLFMQHIRDNEVGMTLHVLFMGIMKEKHQFECNFVLYFVPLTRLGWHNAKDWIMKYSEGK